jgi:signal transduction histidine kinase/ActR/RegA family two-component response regulator
MKTIRAVSNTTALLLRYLPKGSSLPFDVWQKRHKAMVTLLWLHVPALFIVGVATHHGTLHVLGECSILTACAVVASQRWARLNIPMVATTFGLLTSSALLVHFSEGVIEMHFHFFVMVAAVTLYQAWVPFIVAIAYVVGQHTIIGILDPSSVYNHAAAVANPWKWAFIHGLFIMGESVTLLVAWRLNEDARHDAETAYQKRLQEEEARREAQEQHITDLEEAEMKRANLEAQLRQAQKMEALGQLAGGVAHDFNNLLFVIQNYARFGIEGLDEADPRREDIGEVLAASERGADLVRQLLSFSRKDEVTPEVLDLNEAVTEIGKILRRTLGEHIDLDLDLDPDLFPIESDRGHLQQVLMNLAINSQDAMPGGGRLTVETTNVTLDGRCPEEPTIRPGRYARLTVCDDGEGMDPAVRDRVFEPFFTTKEIGEGTGLGLATVYGIVEQWNGFITIESEPGVGTQFDVYLPASLSEPEARGPRRENAREVGRGETVLVVEDEALVLELVRRILENSGFDVVTAGSMEGALAALDEAEIDLLLTDLVMPGASGVDLATQAKQRYPSLPVVFMSGYSTDVLSHHEEMGNVDLLTKPFSSTQLVDQVREALGRENAAA